MSTVAQQQLTKLRRRRGVVRSSVTRLEKRISELEEISEQPTTPEHARELAIKLESLDADFQAHHMELIDLIDDDMLEGDEELLDKEQEVIDEHDDLVSDMKIRLNRLCSVDNTISITNDNIKLAKRKLSHLKGIIAELQSTLTTSTSSSDEEIDISLLEEFMSQISDHKTELSEILHLLLSLEETTEVTESLTLQSSIEHTLFSCSHLIRKKMKLSKDSADGTSASVTDPSTTGSGVRLPKLAVPTFDGNLLN